MEDKLTKEQVESLLEKKLYGRMSQNMLRKLLAEYKAELKRVTAENEQKIQELNAELRQLKNKSNNCL